MEITDYMDAARRRHGLTSDRQLGSALGLNPVMASYYRRKKAWPGDETMVRLAELAGVDPLHALIELNAWRAAPEGRARDVYVTALRRITTGLIFAFALMGLGVFSGQVKARTGSGPEVHNYILCDLRRWWRRWLARWFKGASPNGPVRPACAPW